jgi:cytoskeletal protein RodZ
MPPRKKTNNSKENRDKKKKPSAKRKAAKKRSSKKVEKDIAKAIEHIPEIVTKEVHAEKTEPAKEEKKTDDKKHHPRHFTYPHHHEKRKKRVLWFGVLCLTTIVAAMWIWSTQVFLYQVQAYKQKAGDQTDLWNTVKDDFQDVLHAIDREEQLKEATRAQVEKDIKNAESEQKLEQGIEEIIKETISEEKK